MSSSQSSSSPSSLFCLRASERRSAFWDSSMGWDGLKDFASLTSSPSELSFYPPLISSTSSSSAIISSIIWSISSSSSIYLYACEAVGSACSVSWSPPDPVRPWIIEFWESWQLRKPSRLFVLSLRSFFLFCFSKRFALRWLPWASSRI